VELRDHPELAPQLKVIDALGPASIQPVVIASSAPAGLKHDVQTALLAMAGDEEGRRGLTHGFVKRFVAVTDADYDDIRSMLKAAEAAHSMVLR